MLSQADVLIRAARVTRYSCFCSHSQDNKAHQLQNVCLIAIVILLGLLFKFLCIQKKRRKDLWPFGQYSDYFLCTFNILHKTYICTSSAMVKNFLLQCSNFPDGPRLPKAHAQLTKMCT